MSFGTFGNDILERTSKDARKRCDIVINYSMFQKKLAVVGFTINTTTASFLGTYCIYLTGLTIFVRIQDFISICMSLMIAICLGWLEEAQ